MYAGLMATNVILILSESECEGEDAVSAPSLFRYFHLYTTFTKRSIIDY